MKNVLVGIGVVVLAVFVYLGYRHLSPQHQIKVLVAHEADLWNEGDVQGLFATFTPRMQSTCPLASLTEMKATVQRTLGDFDAPPVSVTLDAIHVNGSTATATGKAGIGPGPGYQIPEGDPVVFVKTSDGWKLDSAGKAGDEACATHALPTGIG